MSPTHIFSEQLNNKVDFRPGLKPKLTEVTVDIFSRSNSEVDQIVEVVREAIVTERISDFKFKKPASDWWRVVVGDVEVKGAKIMLNLL